MLRVTRDVDAAYMRDVASRTGLSREGVRLVMPRYAMSFMKGPLTRGEIRRALGEIRNLVELVAMPQARMG